MAGSGDQKHWHQIRDHWASLGKADRATWDSLPYLALTTEEASGGLVKLEGLDWLSATGPSFTPLLARIARDRESRCQTVMDVL